MDDRFLEDQRREPRPEFARDLRERLRSIEGEEGAPAFRLSPALAGAVAVAVVALLFTLPSVRASAQAMLDLFRVHNFAAVPFDASRLERIRSIKDENGSLGMFDDAEKLQDPGPPRGFATLDEANAAANLAARRPTFLPNALQPDSVWVTGEAATRLTLHEARLRSVLEALGLDDVQVPAGLDGQAVTVRLSPVVVQRYKNERRHVALIQSRSPEVSAPAGADFARLGEVGLRILGLDPAEARRMARSIDWHTTMVVPVPMNASQFRQVTVHGRPGLFITSRSDAKDAAARHQDRNVVLWTENGFVYGLSGDLDDFAMMQVAESVQ